MRAAIIDDRADDREILFRELDSVLRERDTESTRSTCLKAESSF